MVDVEEFNRALTGTDNPQEINTLVGEQKTRGIPRALAKVIVFRIIMLACYLILIFCLRAKGGYSPIVQEKD